ncbi:MAG: hypothetical protein ABJE95_24205 [Byssovorax sp.]
MRTAYAISVGVALAFAPGRASADPPRLSMRLEYVRGSGGQACPAEPTTLRSELAARMGYDPFDEESALERLAVVIVASKGRGFAAHVERFNAAGERTWSETFPSGPVRGNCEALMSPLASYLRASFMTYRSAPATPPAAPPPEPLAPLPRPPLAPARELPAPPVQPAKLPEPPSVPNPARATLRNVAIVAYAAAGAFLGLGIAWSVDVQNKGNTAQALAVQPYAGGYVACMNGDAPGGYCASLLRAWQSQDKAVGLRNGWFGAAGASGAIGLTATIWALSLPTTIKGQPQTQITLRPGGLVIRGAF